MRYISLIIGGILALSACHDEVKFAGNHSETGEVLIAGFRDTLVSVFENVGTGKLTIDFSQALAQETILTVTVAAEENMQENEDFFITSKILSVAGGEKSIDIEYVLVDDNKTNDIRSFSLKLVSLNGGYINEECACVRVKVLDDESDVAVGFEKTATTVAEREPGSMAGAVYRCEIPVKIYGTLGKPLQFKVAVLPAEGANAAMENVNFRLLQTVFVVENASDVISVPVEIIDDAEVNADRIFTLDITEVTGGEIYTYQKHCSVTIKNDDMGIYFGKARVENYENAGKVKIPVKLTPGAANTDIPFVLAVTGLEEDVDYRLTKEWTIPAGQEEIDIEMELLHREGIAPDRTLTLEFASVEGNVTVFEEQPTCEVSILDVDTELDFKYAEYGIKTPKGNVEIPVVLNGEALTHDVSFTVGLNLPAGVEATVDESFIIPAGETSATVLVKVSNMGVSSFTMKIKNVQGATGVVREVQVSRFGDIPAPQGLTVADFSSEQTSGEPAPSGFAAAAVDGNPSSYWHSSWSPETTLPQYIIVQVPDNIHVGGVDIIRRVAASNSDNKIAEIFLSEDKRNWDLQGTVEWAEAKSVDLTEHLRHMDFNHLQKGGYIKINVTEGRRNFAQIGEVIIYGYAE